MKGKVNPFANLMKGMATPTSRVQRIVTPLEVLALSCSKFVRRPRPAAPTPRPPPRPPEAAAAVLSNKWQTLMKRMRLRMNQIKNQRLDRLKPQNLAGIYNIFR